MSAVTVELENALKRLDAQSAAAVERLVRDVIQVVEQQSRPQINGPVDEKGWPVGYFENTAGSFADEPLEAPDDPPPAPAVDW